MHKQETEVKVPKLTLTFIILWIMFVIVMATNIRHRETIEIYEEYYVLDEEMDVLHRQWTIYYQHYSEVEYYLKYYEEKYLRYLELKKIIGEFEK